jgi:DNA-binding SARP family transcriptional activator
MNPHRQPLEIYLFGGLEVRGPDGAIRHTLPTRRMVALLVFLLLHPNRAFQRSYLAGTIWPDASEDAARAGLRVALVALRKLLEADAPRGSVLQSSRGEILLRETPDLRVDVWEFRRRVSGLGSPGTRVPEPRAPSPEPLERSEGLEALAEAAALYRGPVVPDVAEEWLLPLRDELRQRALECVQCLSRIEEERRQHTRAIPWAQRALAIDPCAEESHRALMRLYAVLGERANAIHQYHECRRILREELGATPDETTQHLFRQLRSQARPPAPLSPEPATRVPELWSPLVGRERELASLRQAWERARSGRGGCVLLAGEAGVGKSRLGRELLHDVAASGGLVLYGQAREAEDRFLYLPLLEPMRQGLHLAEEQRLELPEKVWMGHVARLLPELRGDGATPSSPAHDPSPILEGLTRFFVTLSTQRPVCLFLEDLHWADAATGEFVRYFYPRIQSARVLLLGSYRAGEVPAEGWLHALLLAEGLPPAGEPDRERGEQRSGITRVRLSRLDKEAVAAMLAHLGEEGASEALLEPLGERLLLETEGNPFFLLEQLRVLFEQGWLELTDEDRWRVASERLAVLGLRGEPVAARLPLAPTVRAVVQQRVARLREEDRHLLACAAVIGRNFTFDTLRRAAGADVDTVLVGVERLLAAELIRTRADGFDFSHDQIRESVIAGLTPIRRLDLHRRVGEALEATSGLDEARLFEVPLDAYVFRSPVTSPEWARIAEVATQLAHHYHEAAALIGPEKAARYYLVAGARERDVCDYGRAIGHLETSYALLEAAPSGQVPPVLWEQVVSHLAPAYRGVGRGAEAYALLRSHLSRCQAEGEPIWLVRAYLLLGSFLFLHRSFQEEISERECYETAIALCRRHGLDDWIVCPQSHLAYHLAFREGQTEAGGALARAAWDRASEEMLRVVGRRLATVLLLAAARRHDWEEWKSVFRASVRWGGPWAITLNPILTEMEGDCLASGQIEVFHALCRRAIADLHEAGRKRPFQEWFLTPAASTLPVPRWEIEERFSGRRAGRRLALHDPTGRSRTDLTTRPGWLSLWPAPGTNLWPESDLNAPRLVIVAGRGDWVAQTHLALPGVDRIFAGLVVWQNELHFARLEWQRRFRGGPIVEFEGCFGGPWDAIGRGCLAGESVWLRLERVGETLRALCSIDGRHWLTAGTACLPRAESEQVGIGAIVEHGEGPACFEGFWFTPIGVAQGSELRAQSATTAGSEP